MLHAKPCTPFIFYLSTLRYFIYLNEQHID